MHRALIKKIVSVILAMSFLLALFNLPASAIEFPIYGIVTKEKGADVYSQPGYIVGGSDGRLDPSKPSDKLGNIPVNEKIKLLSIKQDADGDAWYEACYGTDYSKKGFVMCNAVKPLATYKTDEKFENWLTEQKFPESYKPALRELHTLYPNWKFYADHTNLDFNEVVKAQNGGISSKYVHMNSDISWKTYEQGEYNWELETENENDRWKKYDGSWVKTTDQVVAYYIDPRNFLDTRSIFMFASEKFDPARETVALVKNAVKGTFMDAALPDDQKKTYADVILAAAQKSGVSTATIVALILQEQGSKGESNLISGKYTYTKKENGKQTVMNDLVGYYNFFNIGAYAEPDKGFSSAVQRGLWWAKGAGSGATSYNRPWNTREKAIIGGAEYYGGNYVKVGQDTIYYKNFNVFKNTTHDLHTHQYATNVQDSLGKGTGMANAMFSLLDGEVIFHIPIYKNMPEKTELPKTGTNNNRFLGGLSIQGHEEQISNFDKYVYSYEAIVPHESYKINILATPLAADAKVTGAGEVRLKTGNNELSITVTSSSGLTCIYNLSVYRKEPDAGEAEIPELTTEYKVTTKISGVAENTNVETFKKKLGVEKGKAVIISADGKEKTEGMVVTGDTLYLYDANGKIRQTYPIVIGIDTEDDGTNSFLRRLFIQGYEEQFVSFKSDVYSYKAVVKFSSDKINIVATSSSSTSTVTGTGQKNLNVGNNEFEIKVTASKGNTSTYKLLVVRESAPELNTDYKTDSNITGIQPETQISAFITKLGVKNGKAVITDASGKEKTSGLIATGDTVNLYDNNNKIYKSYPVVIYGDIDGNGKINSIDLLAGQKHILKQRTLGDVYVKAMDIDHNSSINSVDLLVGQRHILKIKQIVQ